MAATPKPVEVSGCSVPNLGWAMLFFY